MHEFTSHYILRSYSAVISSTN